MDPISIGLGIVGLGMTIFGGLGQAKVAKEQAQLSSQIAGISGQQAQDELQVQAQKQQQVQLEANRQRLQNFRNIQQAQALGLAAATAQGAQFGSGLKGGQASAESQGFENALGINQAQEISNKIYGFDVDIGQKNIQIANLKSQSALLGGESATDQGYASLGGALIKAGPIVGAFAKNIGASFGSVSA